MTHLKNLKLQKLERLERLKTYVCSSLFAVLFAMPANALTLEGSAAKNQSGEKLQSLSFAVEAPISLQKCLFFQDVENIFVYAKDGTFVGTIDENWQLLEARDVPVDLHRPMPEKSAAAQREEKILICNRVVSMATNSRH